MKAESRRKKRLDRSIKVRTEGLYALSSWAEILYLVLPRAVLIFGLLLIPLFLDMYWRRVICAAGIYALLALGFDFLAEFVGLVCLGGAFFIGAGGYISGLLNAYAGWPPFVCIPIATLSGAVISTLILVPALRLRGIYFAIASFMFPLFAVYIIIALSAFGGTEGISALDTLPNQWSEIYLILGVVLISLFGLRRLVNEDMGLILRGIKDNDQAVRASGISITAYKIKAVFIASLMGCFGGAYLSHLYGWLGISLFGMDFSILPIAATVMGGMGTLAGGVLGALILTPLSEALRGFGQLRVVLYCFILLLFIVYKPEGFLSYFQRKYHQFEVWEEV
ncbi:MAG: branched-chain amino acid ABC transporter permease [Deltaproteobacteria bacterium]|nr:branched-chain amino acid ABC transporter permease [Deltaproteobacteria bacterium]MBW1930439.1 branched-chain amino acid ABC transporter permease [Deltaproteobacteria bacterium]MBW2025369.1 branched-chain amino acid ABC transporter permease [Deltaproteobacteria bacterium]MBW2125112.1 branched-chain amino acid ABC transporter permease [Deltaproteobacteria bacterium]RLB13936.1 MAG: branched-chain amino acid ABC transporter permease [Deltaproteobacteria bacterium]